MSRYRLGAILAAAGMVALGNSTPAAADPTASSRATFAVTGGALEITVDSGGGRLGRIETSADGGVLTGRLGQVVVKDRRAAPAGSGWVATVVATPFTTPRGPAISPNRIRYTAGPISRTGVATYTAQNPKGLKKPIAAVTATDVTGDNTATWTPTITVEVPGGLVAGTYSATITHSVL